MFSEQTKQGFLRLVKLSARSLKIFKIPQKQLETITECYILKFYVPSYASFNAGLFADLT